MAETTYDPTLAKPSGPGPETTDSKGLLLGIAFCVLYVVGIRALAPLLEPIAFAPDSGFAHYYWKLPEPSFLSRATAWGGYILHQVAIWACIAYAQEKGLKYQNKLHPVNIAALAINALFVLLHLLQTHLFYDGTAQDTHILTAQGSVIVMLVMILIMENKRRGLAFGAKAPISANVMDAMRKYHGYIFSWAVIYTFWYHPMESTGGHLLGTLYTTLIMVQGSLMFTRIHLNKWWTGFLEVWVVVHGTSVAVISGNASWAQFLFGFVAMFVVTQMHGLGLSKAVRWAFVAAYAGGVVFTYAFVRPLADIHEIVRVPAVEYGLVFVFAVVTWGLLALIAPRPKPAESG